MKKILLFIILLFPIFIFADSYNFDELNVGDYISNGSSIIYNDLDNMKKIYFYEKNSDDDISFDLVEGENNVLDSNLSTGWIVCDMDEVSIRLCNSNKPNTDTINDPYLGMEEENPYTKDNVLLLSILLGVSLLFVIILFRKKRALE